MPFVAVRCGDRFLVLARPSSYAELTRRVCDAFALAPGALLHLAIEYQLASGEVAPVQLCPSAYAHVDDGTVLRCVLAPAQPHPHTVWVVVNPQGRYSTAAVRGWCEAGCGGMRSDELV
jgi:hypothetical protein